MIPRYILGNWWSRYWAYTQDELQSLMQEFRARDIPLSVCIVDMDWHITKTGNESEGWTGYTWNRELFPTRRGSSRGCIRRDYAPRSTCILLTGVHPHEEQYEEMARWMGIDPKTKTPIPFDISDPRFMEGYLEILHHPYESPLPLGLYPEAKRSGIGVRAALTSGGWIGSKERNRAWQGLDPLWALNHFISRTTVAMDAGVRSCSHAGAGSATIVIPSVSVAILSSNGVRWHSSLISHPPPRTLLMAGGVTILVDIFMKMARPNFICAGCSSVSSVPSSVCTARISLRWSVARGQTGAHLSRSARCHAVASCVDSIHLQYGLARASDWY